MHLTASMPYCLRLQNTACSDGLKMAGWAGLVPDGTVPASFYCSGWMDPLDGKDAGRSTPCVGLRSRRRCCPSEYSNSKLLFHTPIQIQILAPMQHMKRTKWCHCCNGNALMSMNRNNYPHLLSSTYFHYKEKT